MSTNGKNDPIDGIAGAVEGLAVSPTLTSDELAYRLARKVAELADDDPHFLGEAQDAAGVIAGVLGDSIAAGPWAEIVDRIERHFDRTAPGREAEQEAGTLAGERARRLMDSVRAEVAAGLVELSPAELDAMHMIHRAAILMRPDASDAEIINAAASAWEVMDEGSAK